MPLNRGTKCCAGAAGSADAGLMGGQMARSRENDWYREQQRKEAAKAAEEAILVGQRQAGLIAEGSAELAAGEKGSEDEREDYVDAGKRRADV